jgi:hypothetical protein
MGNLCHKPEPLNIKTFDITLLHNMNNILIISNDDMLDNVLLNHIIYFKDIKNGMIVSKNKYILPKNKNRYDKYDARIQLENDTYLMLDNILNNDNQLMDIIKNNKSTLFIRSEDAIKVPNIDVLIIKSDRYVGDVELLHDYYFKHLNYASIAPIFNKYEYINNMYLIINLKTKNKKIDDVLFTYFC